MEKEREQQELRLRQVLYSNEITITDAVEYITDTFFNLVDAKIEGTMDDIRRSVIILGPPGIGKSYAVRKSFELLYKQVSRIDRIDPPEKKMILKSESLTVPEKVSKLLEEMPRTFVYYRLFLYSVAGSEDFFVPRIDPRQGFTTLVPLSALRLLEKAWGGIFHIDEITNEKSRSHQTMLYDLLLDASIGDAKFSDLILVVGTGNRGEDAPDIVEPLYNTHRDRSGIIEVSKVTLDSWINYMFDTHGDKWEYAVTVIPIITGSLMENEGTTEGYAKEKLITPRSLSMVAKEIYFAKKRGNLTEKKLYTILLAGLGREVAEKFTYLLLARSRPIKEILDKPSTWEKLSLMEKIHTLIVLTRGLQKSVIVDPATGHFYPIKMYTEKIAEILYRAYRENKEYLSLVVNTLGFSATYRGLIFMLRRSEYGRELLSHIRRSDLIREKIKEEIIRGVEGGG